MITLPLKTNKNKVAVPHILRSVTEGRMEKQESGIRNPESGIRNPEPEPETETEPEPEPELKLRSG